jgi:hypothetical protein
MSVSAGYLEATVTMAAVAREVGVNLTRAAVNNPNPSMKSERVVL